jgi:hypothetical protein
VRLPRPRRPVTLAVKLVAVTMVLVSIASVAVGVAGVRLLRSYLGTQADRQLRAYAGALVKGSFLSQPVFGGPHPGTPEDAGISVEIVDPGGRHLVRAGTGAGSYGGVPVSAAWIASHIGRLVTVRGPRGHGSWRVVVEAIHYSTHREPFVYGEPNTYIAASARTLPGLPGIVAVGLNLAGISRTIREFALTDLAATLAALLFLAVIGVRFLRVSLRPLALAERAATAAAAGGTARWPSRPGGHGDLARAVDTVLAGRAGGPPPSQAGAARQATERMRQALLGAAAELSTPLSVIRGFGDYYRSRPGLSTADADRMMARVEREAARMAEVTDALRRAAREGPGRQGVADEVAGTAAEVLADGLADGDAEGVVTDGDGVGTGLEEVGDGDGEAGRCEGAEW